MKTWIIFVVLGIAELFLLLVQRIFVEKALTSRGRKPVYEVIAWGFYYFAFGRSEERRVGKECRL